MRLGPGVTAAIFVLSCAGCGPDRPEPVDPHARAAVVETTGCGFASGRTGSGVAIGDGVVLTVAHLVVQSDDLAVSVGGSDPVSAVVTAIDWQRDLALLRVPANGIPEVEMSDAGRGASGLVVGGAASGTVPFEVGDVVHISIEEVLGTDRHQRLGYELSGGTAMGDSGAGAYDDRNRLIGIVFATSDDGAVTWVTAGSEIEDFVGAHVGDTDPIPCEPQRSRRERR